MIEKPCGLGAAVSKISQGLPATWMVDQPAILPAPAVICPWSLVIYHVGPVRGSVSILAHLAPKGIPGRWSGREVADRQVHLLPVSPSPYACKAWLRLECSGPSWQVLRYRPADRRNGQGIRATRPDHNRNRRSFFKSPLDSQIRRTWLRDGRGGSA